ncbi:type II secretion system major pseudopilin GspG [soil metagenome]
MRKLRRLAAYRKASEAKACQTSEAGFTLVELLVVLVILVLLASLIGPRVIGYLGSSRIKTARLQIESFGTSLELYHLDIGRYPTTAESLDALVHRPPGSTVWNGPYLNKASVPVDPWGHPYKYQSPGQKSTFDIYTLGRDNKAGGSDEDADIWN